MGNLFSKKKPIKLLLFGASGAGKSHLMHQFKYMTENNGQKDPQLVFVASDLGFTYRDFIYNSVSIHILEYSGRGGFNRGCWNLAIDFAVKQNELDGIIYVTSGAVEPDDIAKFVAQTTTQTAATTTTSPTTTITADDGDNDVTNTSTPNPTTTNSASNTLSDPYNFDQNNHWSMKSNLFKILSHPTLPKDNFPILVFNNHQDIDTGVDSETMIKYLQLDQIHQGEVNWKVHNCSAMNTQGIYEGFDWLLQQISERNTTQD